MIVDAIPDLKIIGVYDRGIPNQERIVVRAEMPTMAGQFGLLLGIQQGNGFAYPIADNFFWFGDGYLFAGDWIFVYTGPGQPRINEIPNRTEKIYTVHWGRKTTILNSPHIVPILIRLGGVAVHTESPMLPSPAE